MKKEEIIDELLTRGIGEFIDPDGEFRKKLLNNPEKVVIKFGVDPTRPDIHLGHAVVFRALRKFQDLGCKVVFLVGDYTAQIGDPTGKSKVRPEIEQEEVENNVKTYLDQVGKILDTKSNERFSWIRNSDWFTAITDIFLPKGTAVNAPIKNIKGETVVVEGVDANTAIGKAHIFSTTRMQIGLGMEEFQIITLRSFLWTLKHITFSRLIERDMFQERIKNNKELYMHEMLYPVLQGIDSFAIKNIYKSCDLEVGGTDQTFNMLMGRDVMKMNDQKPPQAVLSMNLLVGTDGKEKMSKSLDNYIAITDEPNNMFGKVMSIPDSAIVQYFELCTYSPLSDIEEIKEKLNDGKTNPRDLKIRLAKEIVAIYHGENAATEAEKSFVNTFSKKEIPSDIKQVNVEKGSEVRASVLGAGIVSSKSEYARLVEQGAVSNLTIDKKIEDLQEKIEEEGVYRVGKKHFIKFIPK